MLTSNLVGFLTIEQLCSFSDSLALWKDGSKSPSLPSEQNSEVRVCCLCKEKKNGGQRNVNRTF